MVGDSLGEGQESLGDEDGESGEGEEDGGEESKDRMVGVCLSLVVEHHPEVGEMVAVADSQSGLTLLLTELTARPGPGETSRVPPHTDTPCLSQVNLGVAELQSDQGGLQLHCLVVNRETDQLVVKV